MVGPVELDIAGTRDAVGEVAPERRRGVQVTGAVVHGGRHPNGAEDVPDVHLEVVPCQREGGGTAHRLTDGPGEEVGEVGVVGQRRRHD